MGKPKVLVLGSTGFLGSAIIHELAFSGNDHCSTFNKRHVQDFSNNLPFTVGGSVEDLLEIADPDLIINCIVRKSANKGEQKSFSKLLHTNSLFPHQIARAAKSPEIKVLNISTNSIFSGRKGNYLESSLPSPRNLYSLSKLLGESKCHGVHNLRVSFVPSTLEKAERFGPIDWLIKANPTFPAVGFENHFWNGLTDEVLAKLLVSLINDNYLLENLPHTLHFFSRDQITKFQLYETLLEKFLIPSQQLVKGTAPSPQKLTLSSNYLDYLSRVWQTAGYSEILRFCDLF